MKTGRVPKKKYNIKQKCTIVLDYSHSNGEPRNVSKKNANVNRAMVSVVPDEEVTT